jgi:hypothetical protein
MGDVVVAHELLLAAPWKSFIASMIEGLRLQKLAMTFQDLQRQSLDLERSLPYRWIRLLCGEARRARRMATREGWRYQHDGLTLLTSKLVLEVNHALVSLRNIQGLTPRRSARAEVLTQLLKNVRDALLDA